MGMDSRLLFGLGIGLLSLFIRWRFPSAPKPIATFGAIFGLCLAVWSQFPAWPPLLAITGIALIASNAALLDAFINKPPPPPTAPAPEPPHPALFESQLAELREIEEFVGRKDENELRETFDFLRMLNSNVRLVRRSITGNAEPDVDEVFEGGASRVKLPNVKMLPNPEGGIHSFEFIPGRVAMVNLSKRHLENERKLKRFIDSAQVPRDVVEALKKIAAAVEKNVEAMIDLLDEALQASPENFIHHDKPKETRAGWINNQYWRRFENLKPLAAEVSEAIRRHLKVI